jgi:hypothetical protein
VKRSRATVGRFAAWAAAVSRLLWPDCMPSTAPTGCAELDEGLTIVSARMQT